MRKVYRFMGLFVCAFILAPVSSLAATIDYVFLFSENRQYSTLFPNAPQSGNPFHYMIGGADILNNTGDFPVVDVTTTDPPFSTNPYGTWGPLVC